MIWFNLYHEHVLPFLGVTPGPVLGVFMVLPLAENGDARRYLDRLVKRGLAGSAFATKVNIWVRLSLRFKTHCGSFKNVSCIIPARVWHTSTGWKLCTGTFVG